MADSKATDGISQLAKLAGAIVSTKTSAASKLSPGLTPVAGEITAGLPRTPAVFPYDYPDQVLTQTIATLTHERDTLDSIITALKLLQGDPAVVTAEIAEDKRVTQHALEIEADRRVADQAKAEAGDKKAVERVNTASPMAEVVEAVEARDRKRAAVLTAMMGEAAGAAVEETYRAAAAVTPVRENLVEQTAEFTANYERLKQEAQSAAFTKPAAGAEWTCPQHGDTSIAVKVSPRRGVKFRKCAVVDCHEFEKV